MKFGTISKQDRFETPVADYHPVVHGRDRQLWSPHRPPVNEYQALMECLPHESPEMTEQEREQDWDGFQQKLDRAGLSERELLVLDCTVLGGMSLSRAAIIVAQYEGTMKVPSKMTIKRCRDRAVEKLREAFSERYDNE